MKKILCLLGYFLFSAASILAQESVPIFHQEITWSPDGKSLSFTTYRKPDPKSNQAISEVYVIRLDGSGLQRVSEDAAWTSWSKDGKRILFSKKSEDKKSENIYSARTDGSGLVQLTSDANRSSHPAFSPNGKMIAFTSNRQGGKFQIFVMKADGSGAERLTTDSNVSYENPMLSPDSKKIVYYVEKGDQKDQIWTMRADGSNQTLLTGNVGHNIYPAW